MAPQFFGGAARQSGKNAAHPLWRAGINDFGEIFGPAGAAQEMSQKRSAPAN
jgi:hypothetical protein